MRGLVDNVTGVTIEGSKLDSGGEDSEAGNDM